jgi:hypothetical protein
LNDKDGRTRYGDYRLDLHEGPIVVEEAELHPKNGRYIWVSVATAGSFIRPKSPPEPNKAPKDIIAKFEPKLKSKHTP